MWYIISNIGIYILLKKKSIDCEKKNTWKRYNKFEQRAPIIYNTNKNKNPSS